MRKPLSLLLIVILLIMSQVSARNYYISANQALGSVTAGTKIDNTTNTIDVKAEADALPEDTIKMIIPMLGDKQITYSGTGTMPIFANGVQTNIDSTMTHIMPQGAIGYLFRHGPFYELVYNTQSMVIRGSIDAGVEFVAFGMKFRMPTSGIRSLEVMSADGSTHTATGRVLGIDANGVHSGASVISITTTWKRLGNWNFSQIGDQERWVFRYRDRDYRLTFIVFGSYNNNRIIVERI